MELECLALFAKYWQPGSVKTRLARSIGEVQAARVFQAMVTSSVRRLSKVASRRVVVYSPDNPQAHTAFSSSCCPGWCLEPQVQGDLGERLSGFFGNARSAGTSSVVVVGSDTPTLPLGYVKQAFQLLRSHEVVLGPAEDGGYYLIGLARPMPEVFVDMPWGTKDLWQTTVDRIVDLGASYQALPTWYDIDDIDDLNRLLDELQQARHDDPALEALQQQLDEILTLT